MSNDDGPGPMGKPEHGSPRGPPPAPQASAAPSSQDVIDEPAPQAPDEAAEPPTVSGPPLWLKTALAVVFIAGPVFAVVLGVVADLNSVLGFTDWRGIAAVTSLASGLGFTIWLYQSDRLNRLWQVRTRTSPGDWANRLIPLICLVASGVLALPATTIGLQLRDIPAGETATGDVLAGCSDISSDQSQDVYSHSRFAPEAFSDIDIGVRTGGFVQQRFFARSDYVTSVGVIVSRPAVNDQPAFNKFEIGQVRLSMYRADMNAENGAALPLKMIGTAGEPDPDGVTMMAGENHKNTVFHICPTKVQVGERYAFRVTNEEPNVVLAFSLSTLEGPRTSMDIVGQSEGNDRTRINYHQVAGYVCSIANC